MTTGAREASRRPTIVIVEGRTLFRDCIVGCLRSVSDYDVVGVANGQEWQELSRTRSAALFVLSIPTHRSREELDQEFRRLIDSERDVPTIVLSGMDEMRTIVEAIDRGAKGFISTRMPLDVAIAAMQFVSAGGTFVPAERILAAARQQVEHPVSVADSANGLFTARQAAVVEALRKGKANKLIAYELMCESTVKVHVRKIMRKLKATNRTEVAYLANEFMNRSSL
jgi:DNA-binding NarL/FixJ family response regulator